MTSARLLFKRLRIKQIIIVVFLFIVAILSTFLFFDFKYSGKILPNVFISDVNVGGLNHEDAVNKLSQNIKVPEKVKLINQEDLFEIATNKINLTYDFNESANRAYYLSRTGNIFLDSFGKIKLLYSPKNIGLTTKIDEDVLSKFISVVAGQISVDPVMPTVSIVDRKIQINRGEQGTEMDSIHLRADIGIVLAYTKNDIINIPVTEVDPRLSDIEVLNLQKHAEKLIGRELKIKFESQTNVVDNFTYTDSLLLKLINPKGGINEEEIAKLISGIAKKINREPQNPKFKFEGERVSEFEPALDGVKLDENKLRESLINVIVQIENSEEEQITFDAPVIKTPPDVSTDGVNNLGIKELIGRGSSTYFHSIPGRVFNVSLATSRINGVLVKPGDTFSFNNALGDVSQFTGYQQAYIISEGKTILGDGGGVCQVSSTLFRALLNAGLPITERTAHAYRVGYYEQNSPPGMDATVYGPVPDLKFKNDTDNYILIVAKADPKHFSLIFELYGTKDGRIATISKPVVSNVTPALPTVYRDDPSLAVGTLKQVDYSASGAKVSFNYSVTRNGQAIISKKFISNYRPWAAVYLRGIKP